MHRVVILSQPRSSHSFSSFTASAWIWAAWLEPADTGFESFARYSPNLEAAPLSMFRIYRKRAKGINKWRHK